MYRVLTIAPMTQGYKSKIHDMIFTHIILTEIDQNCNSHNTVFGSNMNGQMPGWACRQMAGRTDRQTEDLTNDRTDRWTDGQADAQTDS